MKRGDYVTPHGGRLFQLRQDRHLSRELLSDAVRKRVSPKTIKRIELGKRVRVDSVRILADYFQIELQWLLIDAVRTREWPYLKVYFSRDAFPDFDAAAAALAKLFTDDQREFFVIHAHDGSIVVTARMAIQDCLYYLWEGLASFEPAPHLIGILSPPRRFPSWRYQPAPPETSAFHQPVERPQSADEISHSMAAYFQTVLERSFPVIYTFAIMNRMGRRQFDALCCHVSELIASDLKNYVLFGMYYLFDHTLARHIWSLCESIQYETSLENT